MWRLNFLVFFACVLLDNDYVLYYICPMHTFFTLMVFGVLAIGHKYNEVPSIMAIKFVVCFAVIAIVWEIPGVFEFVWRPFTFLMGKVLLFRASVSFFVSPKYHFATFFEVCKGSS